MSVRMSYHEFADYVNVISGERDPEFRFGQWAFIVLRETHPDVAQRLVCTSADPFHNDLRVPYFLSRILLEYVAVKGNE